MFVFYQLTQVSRSSAPPPRTVPTRMPTPSPRTYKVTSNRYVCPHGDSPPSSFGCLCHSLPSKGLDTPPSPPPQARAANHSPIPMPRPQQNTKINTRLRTGSTRGSALLQYSGTWKVSLCRAPCRGRHSTPLCRGCSETPFPNGEQARQRTAPSPRSLDPGSGPGVRPAGPNRTLLPGLLGRSRAGM